MKWFKHDSDAHLDAKLKRLKLRYGMEGYGLYWYCLELIAYGVTEKSITFTLEEDSEIISHETRIQREEVENMMQYMVELGLFESSDGHITCLKLAKRLDQSMTSHAGMRKLIKNFKEQQENKIMISHDPVMIKSCPEKEIEIKKEIKKKKKKRCVSLPDGFCVSDNVKKWARENGHDMLQERLAHFTDWALASGKTYVDWDRAFMNAIRGDWARLNGKQTKLKDISGIRRGI